MSSLNLLLLLIACNAAPILAERLLGRHGAWPLDAGRVAPDGHPWLGRAKTWRGLGAAVAVGVLVAAWLDLSLVFGAWFALLSMLGDLLSSFLKRRLGLPSSARATFLDQIPEALLPLLYAQVVAGLGWLQLVCVLVAFFLFEWLGSPALFRLGLRKRPH